MRYCRFRNNSQSINFQFSNNSMWPSNKKMDYGIKIVALMWGTEDFTVVHD